MSTCEKVSYKTQTAALLTAARQAGRHNTNYLRAYYCKTCKAWHLTSKKTS